MSSDAKTLIKLYRLLGVVPSENLHRYKLAFLLFLIVFTSYYTCHNIYKYTNSIRNQGVMTLTVLNLVSMLCLNFSTVFTYNRREKSGDLFKLLSVYDDLYFGSFRRRIPSIKHLKLLLLCTYFLITAGGVVQLAIPHGRDFLGSLNQNVHLWYEVSTTVYLIMFLKLVHVRFTCLSEAIQEPNSVIMNRLESVVRCYHLLCDLIYNYNSLYGLIAVFRVINNIFAIVLAITITVHIPFYTVDSYIWYYWLGVLTIQLVVITGLCKAIDEERGKCLRFACNLKSAAKTKKTYRAVEMLLHIVTHRSIVVTAGGFFKTDFTLLFTFVNIVATYTTAICQLLPQKLTSL